MLTKKELGNLIKAAREIKSKQIGKRYTQKLLANDIGKSQSYIGDIESGRTYPSFVILNAIAKACGIPMGFFETDEKINENIDKFVTLQLQNLEKEEVYKIREAIKNDPSAKINHVYDYLHENQDNPYITPQQIVKHMLMQKSIMDFCKLDETRMMDEDFQDFSEEVLRQIELISYKYKK